MNTMMIMVIMMNDAHHNDDEENGNGNEDGGDDVKAKRVIAPFNFHYHEYRNLCHIMVI